MKYAFWEIPVTFFKTSIMPPLPESIATPPGWRSRQGTLAGGVTIAGRGLHTGRRVQVRILPVEPPNAPAGAAPLPPGIIFRRMRKGVVLGEVSASVEFWRPQPLCSMLENSDGLRVRTVEHLLAALRMCEIEHAVVEMDDEEVPILDGGAAAWVRRLTAAGRREWPHPRFFLRILRPFEVRRAPSRYLATPAAECIISVRAETNEFGKMDWMTTLTPAVFAKAIAPARSFGALKWALPAILGGLVTGIPILRGARLSSVAAICGRRVIGGMKFSNEFARHRILDMIGDFSLAGVPLLGRIHARKPSHQRNVEFIRALLAAPDAWDLVGCLETH